MSVLGSATAKEKIEALKSAGVLIANDIEDVAETVRSAYGAVAM